MPDVSVSIEGAAYDAEAVANEIRSGLGFRPNSRISCCAPGELVRRDETTRSIDAGRGIVSWMESPFEHGAS